MLCRVTISLILPRRPMKLYFQNDVCAGVGTAIWSVRWCTWWLVAFTMKSTVPTPGYGGTSRYSVSLYSLRLLRPEHPLKRNHSLQGVSPYRFCRRWMRYRPTELNHSPGFRSGTDQQNTEQVFWYVALPWPKCCGVNRSGIEFFLYTFVFVGSLNRW